MAAMSVKNSELMVGIYPPFDEYRTRHLTASERAVLRQLVVGSTNRHIAQQRNTSVCTVANQVRAIFTKLNVHSRSELAARLYGAA